MTQESKQAGVLQIFENVVWDWYGYTASDICNDGTLDIELLVQKLHDAGIRLDIDIGNSSNLLK